MGPLTVSIGAPKIKKRKKIQPRVHEYIREYEEQRMSML